MEEKDNIICVYARTIYDASNSLMNNAMTLSENKSENGAIIKTLNVQLESLRSYIVLMQQAIDAYN